MDRVLIIKILDLLEKAYTRPLTAETLMKKVKLKNIDGEFSQIIKYLKDAKKIMVELVPEKRMNLQTKRDRLHKWLQKIDKISISPAGIDYLTEIKQLEIAKKRNYLISDTTIVLTQIAILGIALTIYDRLKSAVFEIPWLLSAILWVCLISFSLLLLYKIMNIIFSKESWKGILFNRDSL